MVLRRTPGTCRPVSDYVRERTKGNSVCPPVAAALARAQFEQQVIEVCAA